MNMISPDLLKELGPAGGLMLFLNVIGWLMKKSNASNKIIPWVLFILGGAIFPFIVEDGTVVWNSRFPEIYTVMAGCIIGFGAVGTYEGLKNAFGKNDTVADTQHEKVN